MAGGQLAPGSPLPSSRELAASLGIARGTVVLAYEQLLTEGYVVARPGAGMRISQEVPDAWLAPPLAQPRQPSSTGRPKPAPPSPFVGIRPGAPFAPHRCETRELPFEVLRTLHARQLRRSNPWLFGDGPAAGLPALRQAVAAHLREARGLVVDPGQVLIVGSMQQALDISLRVLTRPGDPVWLEDPGYVGARRLVELSGRVAVHVPVDAEGLRVDAALALAEHARMACVTPSRQAPLGVPLSLPRRAQLLHWANRHDAYVFEDDYDSEYRFSSRPVPPLATHDGGRVLLAGSFSKLLYPGLRIAYLVCPAGLLDAMAATLSLTARHPNLLAQAALAAFIEEGHLARHVRRMRRLYIERAEAFVAAARREWAGLLEVPALQAGLDITVRLANGAGDREASASLRKAGVESIPLSSYCAAVEMPPALVMGFAAVDASELAIAAPKVARALE